MIRSVKVGELTLGGGQPILVQSMTNTDTRDTEATLARSARCMTRGATWCGSACMTKPARKP